MRVFHQTEVYFAIASIVFDPVGKAYFASGCMQARFMENDPLASFMSQNRP